MGSCSDWTDDRDPRRCFPCVDEDPTEDKDARRVAGDDRDVSMIMGDGMVLAVSVEVVVLVAVVVATSPSLSGGFPSSTAVLLVVLLAAGTATTASLLLAVVVVPLVVVLDLAVTRIRLICPIKVGPPKTLC